MFSHKREQGSMSAKEKKNVSSYIRDNMPTTPQEWKEWHRIKKERKRKWKEEKLLKQQEQTEKQKKKEETEDQVMSVEEDRGKIGRNYTVSIALPGSILDNAQSPELRTYLAGQIARAAVVFNVDEIVIFDETGSTERTIEGEFEGVRKKGQANVQMARILQYLECPQYLRKYFFPHHKDLTYAGVLNPLDCPHHMRATDESRYREGVVLKKNVSSGKGSYVDVGLGKQECQIDRLLQPGIRVTVNIKKYDSTKKKVTGVVVPPSTPCKESGVYWGYTVRLAPSLGSVFTESPYKDGYDMTVGTSERGDSVDTFQVSTEFRHALVVFGGLKGLEASLEADEGLSLDDPRLLFQHYINVCPDQGSRTIRTEEAILITMSALRPKIQHPKMLHEVS